MKKALNKLKMINQTASALILKKIPYGESEERYDALSGLYKQCKYNPR